MIKYTKKINKLNKEIVNGYSGLINLISSQYSLDFEYKNIIEEQFKTKNEITLNSINCFSLDALSIKNTPILYNIIISIAEEKLSFEPDDIKVIEEMELNIFSKGKTLEEKLIIAVDNLELDKDLKGQLKHELINFKHVINIHDFIFSTYDDYFGFPQVSLIVKDEFIEIQKRLSFLFKTIESINKAIKTNELFIANNKSPKHLVVQFIYINKALQEVLDDINTHLSAYILVQDISNKKNIKNQIYSNLNLEKYIDVNTHGNMEIFLNFEEILDNKHNYFNDKTWQKSRISLVRFFLYCLNRKILNKHYSNIDFVTGSKFLKYLFERYNIKDGDETKPNRIKKEYNSMCKKPYHKVAKYNYDFSFLNEVTFNKKD